MANSGRLLAITGIFILSSFPYVTKDKSRQTKENLPELKARQKVSKLAGTEPLSAK